MEEEDIPDWRSGSERSPDRGTAYYNSKVTASRAAEGVC